MVKLLINVSRETLWIDYQCIDNRMNRTRQSINNNLTMFHVKHPEINFYFFIFYFLFFRCPLRIDCEYDVDCC